MRSTDRSRRGAPLLLLSVLLGGWVTLRAAISILPEAGPLESEVATDLPAASGQAIARHSADEAAERGDTGQQIVVFRDFVGGFQGKTAATPAGVERLGRAELPGRMEQYRSARPTALMPPVGTQAQLAVPSSMLIDRPFAQIPPAARETSSVASNPDQGPARVAFAAREMSSAPSIPRWTGDGWLFLRQGNETFVTSGRPSYGRSQAGATLRYRLAPPSSLAPQLHLRASSALSGPTEREAAIGISVRPLPPVPVRVAGEGRLRDAASGREARAAIYAVTELPPFELPAGFSGEVYAQAGYVTGDFATPFVDGQARVTRTLASRGNASLSVGAGVWGGAQEGSERLDAGPTAAVSFPVGRIYARVSADYRFRVAGDAEPASGPALTLSAGF